MGNHSSRIDRASGEVVHYTILHQDEVHYLDWRGNPTVGSETHAVTDGNGHPLFYTVDRQATEDMVRTLNGDPAHRWPDYQLPSWFIPDGRYRLGAIIDLGRP